MAKGKLKSCAYEAYLRWVQKVDRYHASFQIEWPLAWITGYRAAQRDARKRKTKGRAKC